jgi:hypothetical protein
MNEYSRGRQLFLIAGAFMGWLAVILQFYLILVNRTASVPETLMRYFTFFTVLTNILLTVCFTVLLLKPFSAWGKFFSKTSTLTAITIYMAIVGIIYNLILRSLWNPQGLQLLADELLHVINPLWFLLFWIFFVSKTKLEWRQVLDWLWYPVIYLVVILIRGAFSGFYPYPFSDVGKLGYPKVLINSAKLIAAFLSLALIFIWIGKRLRKSRE